MTADALPVWVLLTSLVASLLSFGLPERSSRVRTAVNVLAAVIKLGLTALMADGVLRGRSYETRVPFLPHADLVFEADPFGVLFVTLSAALWLATTIYAVGYLEGTGHQRRFFGFFSLCVASTMGIALAGNLITFVVFYELLTLSTYPLVVHYGTPEALRAGDTYLRYTLTGGALLLAGVAAVYGLAGGGEFTEGGIPALVDQPRWSLVLTFSLLVAGLGVKAALIPLHGWLPEAMVAPAPVSALLHAVAVVKAGAFGIARVVYDVFGVHLAREVGVLRVLTYVAAATILYGSLRALAQDDLKRRLAYSTVSQLSYIVLGIAVFDAFSTIGGIVHLVHQGLMKVTLFFCAGIFEHELGVKKISAMGGVGRRMPLTMGAFTVAALGMIGVPPVAGYVTKWYLGVGAARAGEPWVIAVLVASGLLNALYFLPILRTAWFGEPDARWRGVQPGRAEVSWWLLLPPVATATLALLAGLFPGTNVSPLAWAMRLGALEYLP